MIRIYPIVNDFRGELIETANKVKMIAITSLFTEKDIAENDKIIDLIVKKMLNDERHHND